MACDTIKIETLDADEVVSIVTAGPQGPSGAEAATLTTTGDLLYRAALANDRLPIGSEGQVLKVASGLPAWANESGAVTEVNGQTGAVTLTASDIGAAPSTGIDPTAITGTAVVDSDARLSDSRTPSAHAASHATAGSDFLAPSDIGAQSIFVAANETWSSDFTLTAARAKQYNVIVSATSNVTLPTSGHQVGDVVVIWRIPAGNGTLTIRRGNPFISTWTIDFGQQLRFRATGTGNADWELVRVDSHDADRITSGTLKHERGGLEADVSAYSGLVKIDAGTTSAVTVTAAGEALLDDADAAAQRTTLGLGNSATLNTGTTAGTVATGDHTHAEYVSVTGDSMTGDLDLGDSVKATFGADEDMWIYHDGGSSYIYERGTGNLRIITNSTVSIDGASGGEFMAQFVSNGAVSLYYDNGKKIETTSSGVSVTGSVNVTDASTTRANLGLGTAATANLGTGASDAAYGNHTHAQLHDRSHAITSTSDHTAGNHKVFYSDGSGQVQELALGNSGEVLTSNGATSAPSFAAKPVELVIACSDETTNLTTGTAKVTFRAPYAFLLTGVRASVNTAPTGSTLIVDINNGANSALSTKLSIDASEKTSTTAATAAVIDTSYDDFSDDAEITIDIDQIGSTVAGKGLKVTLIGTRA